MRTSSFVLIRNPLWVIFYPFPVPVKCLFPCVYRKYVYFLHDRVSTVLFTFKFDVWMV